MRYGTTQYAQWIRATVSPAPSWEEIIIITDGWAKWIASQ